MSLFSEATTESASSPISPDFVVIEFKGKRYLTPRSYFEYPSTVEQFTYKVRKLSLLSDIPSICDIIFEALYNGEKIRVHGECLTSTLPYIGTLYISSRSQASLQQKAELSAPIPPPNLTTQRRLIKTRFVGGLGSWQGDYCSEMKLSWIMQSLFPLDPSIHCFLYQGKILDQEKTLRWHMNNLGLQSKDEINLMYGAMEDLDEAMKASQIVADNING